MLYISVTHLPPSPPSTMLCLTDVVAWHRFSSSTLAIFHDMGLKSSPRTHTGRVARGDTPCHGVLLAEETASIGAWDSGLQFTGPSAPYLTFKLGKATVRRIYRTRPMATEQLSNPLFGMLVVLSGHGGRHTVAHVSLSAPGKDCLREVTGHRGRLGQVPSCCPPRRERRI